MNRTSLTLITTTFLLTIGCTNMNPDVKFDPKTDADAYCAIGKKDSKTATRFWDKVEREYTAEDLLEELAEFEAIIIETSQAAAQEYPVRLADRKEEVTFYPSKDAETFKAKFQKDPERALKYWKEIREKYNDQGYPEYLQTFEDSIRLIEPKGVEMLQGRI